MAGKRGLGWMGTGTLASSSARTRNGLIGLAGLAALAANLQGCVPEYACIMKPAEACTQGADSSAAPDGPRHYCRPDTLPLYDTLGAARP